MNESADRDIEKLREMYNLSKEVLYEEHNRSDRLDEKASRYLTVLTLLLGGFSICGKWVVDDLMPPNGWYGSILLLTGLLLFLGLVTSWFLIFRSMKAEWVTKIPFDGHMIKFFEDNDLATVYHDIAGGNAEALATNRQVFNKKCKRLNCSYFIMNISLCLFFLFVLGYVVRGWLVHY